MFNFPVTILSSAANNYATTVLSFNPYFYWRLEQTSGTVIADSSPNNRTGNISGTYTLNQPGSLTDDSKSILFNNGVVQQASSYTIPSSNYTVIVRVKTSATSAGICVFSDTSNGSNSYSPGLYLNSGKLEYYYYNGSSAVYLTSANTFNNNNWHSFAFSIGSAGVKVYANGSIVASHAGTNSLSFGGFWFLGRAFSFQRNPSAIVGNLDEFAYFTTQLSDANILAIHQSI